MKKVFGILALFSLVAVSCGGDPEPEEVSSPAPVLVSTSPENGVTEVSGSSLSVVFTFDQKIRCTVASMAGISIDGGAKVDKVEAYNTDLTVTVSGMEAGKTYVLSLPDGTVEGFRKNQAGSSAITFRFTTWKPDPGPEDPKEWENAASAAYNMGVGWNLGNTLDSNSGSIDNMWIEAFTSRTTSDYETAWGQPVATRELIHMYKEAGFNSIRVPVTWYPHMGVITVSTRQDADGEWHGHWDMSTWKGYDVDPAWMARVKEVVEYVLDEGMYCILNVHHDTGSASTGWLRADRQVYESVRERFCSLWTQIATEFASYGQRLVFESFNEMLDAKGTWNWSTADAHEVINMYNADFVATVRATGGKNVYRNLILNTYAASSAKEALIAFRLPEDVVKDHLMAEVHSYAPYRFAFDTDSPKEVFDASCESEVKGIIDDLNTYFVSKGIPCVLGEFGADTSKRSETELAKQATCYVSAAAKYGIPCYYWMGLSNGEDRNVPKWTKPALKDAILRAFRDNRK